jgi:hypothetical protein
MPNATRSACFLLAVCLLIIASVPAMAAPATVKKSVQTLEDGNFLIKLVVTASKDGIYAFQFTDPKSSIINVYAPRGWCILSDGEMCMSRTSSEPIVAGKSLEFVIYSTVSDTQYVWAFFGPMDQLGNPEVL